MLQLEALLAIVLQAPVAISRYAVGPSGSEVAIAGSTNTVHVVRLKNDVPGSKVFPHPDHVTDLEFSRDGSRLLTACLDGNVRVFEMEKGTEIARFAAFPGGGSCRYPGAHASWSKDGKRLLTSGQGNNATLWDVAGRARIRDLADDSEIVALASWCLASNLVVTATEGPTARLWDGATGEPRSDPVRLPSLELQGFDLAPDGRRLAIGCSDARARIVDMRTGKTELTVSHKDADLFGDLAVGNVTFSRDGSHLLTVSYSFHEVRCWDVATGREEWRTDFGGGNEGSFGTEFSNDGREVFISRRARWVDAKTGALKRQLPDSCIVFHRLSPDGRFVTCVENGRLFLRDGTSLETRYTVALNDDGQVSVGK